MKSLKGVKGFHGTSLQTKSHESDEKETRPRGKGSPPRESHTQKVIWEMVRRSQKKKGLVMLGEGL